MKQKNETRQQYRKDIISLKRLCHIWQESEEFIITEENQAQYETYYKKLRELSKKYSKAPKQIVQALTYEKKGW